MTKAKISIAMLVISAILVVIAYTQFTIFVIPPIGAVPEGRTLIISRMNKTDFVDSADAMCERMQGYVSLMCRIVTMGAIADKATIYMRLPYSDWLYKISTGGKQYER